MSIPDRLDSAIRFSLYVLIFWLPYSPAVVEICVGLSSILWLFKRIYFYCSHEPKPRFYQILNPRSNPLNVPIVLFLASCIFSILGSAYIRMSWHNFFTKTLEWFIIYFLIIETFNKKKYVLTALSVLMVTAVSTAMDSLYQYYISYKDIFLGREIIPGDRATAGFKTANALGGYLAVIIPLSFTCFKLQNKWLKILGSIGVGILTWSLWTTFSRGAWLAVFSGVVFFFTAFRKKTIYILTLVSFCVIICSYFMFLFYGHKVTDAPMRQDTAHWRLNVWKTSLKMIADRPIFGHGINTFMPLYQFYRVDNKGNPTYAHNGYLQLAAEVGLVGLGTFLWIIIRLFQVSIQYVGSIKNNEENLKYLAQGMLAGLLAFLVHSFFDTDFQSLQLSGLFWYFAGLQMAANSLLKGIDNCGIKTAQ